MFNKENIKALPFYEETKNMKNTLECSYTMSQLNPYTENKLPTFSITRDEKIIVNPTLLLGEPPLAQYGALSSAQSNQEAFADITDALFFVSGFFAPIMPFAAASPAFSITAFSVLGVTGPYYFDKLINAKHYRQKTNAKIIRKTTGLQGNLLVKAILPKTKNNKSVTDLEKEFVGLVNKIAANKETLPYYKDISAYLVQIEEYYHDVRCEEVDNNLPRNESNLILQSVINELSDLIDEYLVEDIIAGIEVTKPIRPWNVLSRKKNTVKSIESKNLLVLRLRLLVTRMHYQRIRLLN